MEIGKTLKKRNEYAWKKFTHGKHVEEIKKQLSFVLLIVVAGINGNIHHVPVCVCVSEVTGFVLSRNAIPGIPFSWNSIFPECHSLNE